MRVYWTYLDASTWAEVIYRYLRFLVFHFALLLKFAMKVIAQQGCLGVLICSFRHFSYLCWFAYSMTILNIPHILSQVWSSSISSFHLFESFLKSYLTFILLVNRLVVYLVTVIRLWIVWNCWVFAFRCLTAALTSSSLSIPVLIVHKFN